MEKWNDGTLEYWVQRNIFGLNIIPSFQYSIIPE
jgi:hypothetical protein